MPASPPASPPTFERYGTTLHLELATGHDLARILELDEALWVATSAPIATLHADPLFLRLLDSNGDGRVRVGEMRSGARWLLGRLRRLDVLHRRVPMPLGDCRLPLDALDPEDEEEARIRSGSLEILARERGEPISEEEAERASIDLATVRRVRREEEARSPSDAGVVLPSEAPDAAVGRLFEDVLATVGGEPHPGGERGVTREQLDLFLAQAASLVAWHESAQTDPHALREARAALQPAVAESASPGAGPRETRHPPPAERMVWSDEIAAAYPPFKRLRPKIDEYFRLCQAVRHDPRVFERVWPWSRPLDELDLTSAEAAEARLGEAPLAPPDACGVLDPEGPVNPRYAPALADLARRVFSRLDADATLHPDEWLALKRLFAPRAAWLEQKPETSLDDLAPERLAAYFERDGGEREVVARARAVLAEHEAHALALDDVRRIEKLLLFQAHLLALANSFVAFPDLYDPEARALFEMGTLVVDGRRLTMAVRVLDRARHAAVSDESNLFVLYAKIFDLAGQELYEVAVPVTSGGRGTLATAKRGLFIDRHGKDLEAVVVQIVENPISLAEAVVAPFRRLAAAVTGRIERLSEESAKALETEGATGVDEISARLVEPEPEAPPAAPEPPPVRAPEPAPARAAAARGGMVAGGGIAVAALGSSLAFITSTLSEIGVWKILVTLAVAALAVIVPATLVAFLKLRRRDLSSILEGSGWAVNARMGLTRELARTFTFRPEYPEGAVFRRGEPAKGEDGEEKERTGKTGRQGGAEPGRERP